MIYITKSKIDSLVLIQLSRNVQCNTNLYINIFLFKNEKMAEETQRMLPLDTEITVDPVWSRINRFKKFMKSIKIG